MIPALATASRRTVGLTGGLLAVVTLAAYANSFFGPFIFDDVSSVAQNPAIRHLWPLRSVLALDGLSTLGGRPLANLSFAVDYAIGGPAVWTYHATNLAIHVLAGLALFGIVRRTLSSARLRDRFGSAALPLAATIAGLWLLHPLQTEAVTYIVQRVESLAGLFYLVTLYALVRAGADQPASVGRRLWLGLSVAACFAGMATKEDVVSAPLLVLVYDRTFVTGGFAAAWRARRGYYLALVGSWILLAASIASTHGRGGTVSFDSNVTPLLYLQTQCYAIGHYLRLAFWPHPLVFDYGVAGIFHPAQVWPQASLLLGLFGATLWAVWRRPVLGFVGLWFFAILSPTSSIVPIATQTIAEHRMYLALAAVIVLVVAAAYALLGRHSFWLWVPAAGALGVVTHLRNADYRSEIAIWQDVAAHRPLNYRAHYVLGGAYAKAGDYARSVAEYERALQLDPGASAEKDSHLAHTSLGESLLRLGRTDDAIAHFRTALQIKPDFAPAHLALANALVYEGRIEEAIAPYRTALRLAPREASSHRNLAYALLVTGHPNEAIAEYRTAVQLDPTYAAAYAGLGYALIRANRPGEAIAPCEQALKLRPNDADAHNFLGIALAQLQRPADAIAHFEAALRLNPEAADVHSNLGNALSALHRSTAAISQYRQAVKLDPGYAPAHRNLAGELARVGRPVEAAQQAAIAGRLEAAAAAAQ